MTRIMGDAIGANAASIPRSVQMVAGYVTGFGDVPWTRAGWAIWPFVPHVTIDQGVGSYAPQYAANVIDIESGAYDVTHVADWIKNATAPRPTVYVNRSNVQSAVAAALSVRATIDVWIAMPGWTPGVPLPALPRGGKYVAVQDVYTNAYDLSTVLDDTWPNVAGKEIAVLDVDHRSDGRMIVALTGTDGAVYVTEQPSPGARFSGIGQPVGGKPPITVACLDLVVINDTASIFIQADPSTGNGDVYTAWENPDSTWAPWQKIS